MLYHSRSVAGDDIAVSGVVVVPTAAAPKAGRPVVSWAHGTTGIGDQCAPSKSADAATAIPFVKQLVDAGYVVAATDYEGLGTPGVHPYLVGESEGRGVLDAARARHARSNASDASAQVLIAGHSQGGQAALFAGELASSYAPDLDVLGVAAAAPAADVENILPLAASINGGAGYLAMGIQGFHAAYPEDDPAAVLSPDAAAKSEAATTQCGNEVIEAFQGVSGSSVLAHDPLSIPAIQSRLHENSAGNRPAGVPLLIVQGNADTTIPKVLTDLFDTKACAAGDTVDYRVVRRRHARQRDRRRAGRRGRLAQGPGRGQTRADDVHVSTDVEPGHVTVYGGPERTGWSLWSRNSFLSIGSVGSSFSIGSVGSFCSIASVGSAYSAFSAGSWASFGSILSSLSSLSVLSHRSHLGVLTAPRRKQRSAQ